MVPCLLYSSSTSNSTAYTSPAWALIFFVWSTWLQRNVRIQWMSIDAPHNAYFDFYVDVRIDLLGNVPHNNALIMWSCNVISAIRISSLLSQQLCNSPTSDESNGPEFLTRRHFWPTSGSLFIWRQRLSIFPKSIKTIDCAFVTPVKSCPVMSSSDQKRQIGAVDTPVDSEAFSRLR